MRFNKCVPLAALAVFIGATHASAVEILFVNADAPANGNGLSWETAFDELWEALDAAATDPTVAEIWVAEGLYTPDRGFGDREDSFDLVDDVALLGGFAGGEDSAEERDPDANPTVLSGDFNGDDSASDVDGDGLVEFFNYDDNALNVVAGMAAAGARLDGFVVKSGNADFDGDALRGGGGVFLFDCAATVADCVFRLNTAGTESPDVGGFGGGLFILGGEVSVHDCLFEDNRGMNGGGLAIGSRPDLSTDLDVVATIERCAFRRCFSDFQTGGAMWTATGDPIEQSTIGQVTVRDCVFEECFAQHHGAWTDQNTPELLVEDCVFRNNRSLGFGAGFSHQQTAGPDVEPAQVRRCVFEGNEAATIGAATLIQAANVNMEACTFVGNRGDSIIRCGPTIGFQQGGRSLTLVNCLVADNTGIGVLTDDAPTLLIVNSTIANNDATAVPGVTAGGVVADIDEGGQAVLLDNSIFWGNRGSQTGQPGQIQIFDGAPTVNWSLIDGLTGSFGGDGNIGDDPMFEDEPQGDYRLAAGSPAIDAADNGRVPQGVATDLAGNARFADDPATPDTGHGISPIVDMGAYEFGSTCPADITGDGVVDVDDLLALLAAWGNTSGPEDIDKDGFVGAADLLELLAAWGPCE
jgi:hypothetical protein